jgi:hypothetical protein
LVEPVVSSGISATVGCEFSATVDLGPAFLVLFDLIEVVEVAFLLLFCLFFESFDEDVREVCGLKY